MVWVWAVSRHGGQGGDELGALGSLYFFEKCGGFLG